MEREREGAISTFIDDDDIVEIISEWSLKFSPKSEPILPEAFLLAMRVAARRSIAIAIAALTVIEKWGESS